MIWNKIKSMEKLLNKKREPIARLKNIWKIAEKFQKYQIGSNSMNDRDHCLEVDKYIRIILTNSRIGATPPDYYILSITAAYHDLDKAVQNKKYKEKHGYHSGQIVIENPTLYGLNEEEAKAFSYISTYHYKGRFEDKPPFSIYLPHFPDIPINPRKLAQVFYLADRLDSGISRANDIYVNLKYHSSKIPSKALARNTIQGFIFSDDSDIIEVKLRDMTSLTPNEKRRRFSCVADSLEMIQKEIQRIEKELSALGLPYKLIISREDSERADKKIMTKKLAKHLKKLDMLRL
jgi:hypothetical protein